MCVFNSLFVASILIFDVAVVSIVCAGLVKAIGPMPWRRPIGAWSRLGEATRLLWRVGSRSRVSAASCVWGIASGCGSGCATFWRVSCRRLIAIAIWSAWLANSLARLSPYPVPWLIFCVATRAIDCVIVSDFVMLIASIACSLTWLLCSLSRPKETKNVSWIFRLLHQ